MRSAIALVTGLTACCLALSGCSSCGKKKAAEDAAVAVKAEQPKPEPVVAEKDKPAPAVAEPKKDKRQKADRDYVQGQQVVSDGKPLGIERMPSVTQEDLKDPKLNDKLPMGSKKTLKILQKITEQNPRFQKKEGDPNYTPPPDR